jgi:threonine aldolase
MRQAGVLAAAGIVALEEVAPRLKEDHIRAKDLAAGLSRIPGIILNTGKPTSNMVYISLDEVLPISAEEVAQRLKDAGILVGMVGSRHFRLVTHYWIDDQAVDAIIRTFREILSKYA